MYNVGSNPTNKNRGL